MPKQVKQKRRFALLVTARGVVSRLAHNTLFSLANTRTFLAHALSGYKSGARNNAIMKGFASALSDADIQDLAAYFGSQASTLSTPTNW